MMIIGEDEPAAVFSADKVETVTVLPPLPPVVMPFMAAKPIGVPTEVDVVELVVDVADTALKEDAVMVAAESATTAAVSIGCSCASFWQLAPTTPTKRNNIPFTKLTFFINRL